MCQYIVKISMNTLILRDIIKMVNVSMATSLLIGHLRSEGTSIKTPSHPEPASHNRSSSISQCSWKGGKGSPGLCSRKEGQHRRKEVAESKFRSSGNNKSLQTLQCRGLKGGLDWSHPFGRQSLLVWGEKRDLQTCVNMGKHG